MSIKSPSLKVFIKKNLPKALGGYKFYDQYLSQLTDVSPHKAWTIFHQEFIDEFVNKGSDRKWTAVPYLTPVDCPCSPGSVILVRERSFRRYIKRAPNHAFIAGIVTDFFPPEIKSMPVLVPVQENFERKVGSGAEYKKTYQSKNTEMAVIITMSGVRVSSVEEQLKTETTLLDLDNFDSTGFKSTSCFLITRVLTADTLKVEVTVNGDVFYEHTYSVSVPVCFHANKVRVLDDGRGVVKDMRPVMKKLPLKILRRRVVQHFLNSFLPNQSKLGNAVGDAPAVLNWQEPTALRSYRPNFLPRPERCHQTDMIYYYKTDQELINIIYGQNGHRNTGRSSERPRRNRTRDKRTDLPSTRSSGCEVNNLPFDEIHTIQSEDASSVTSTGTSDDKSSDVTSEITTDTSESY